MERFGKYILLPFDDFEKCLKNDKGIQSTLATEPLEPSKKDEEPLTDTALKDPSTELSLPRNLPARSKGMIEFLRKHPSKITMSGDRIVSILGFDFKRNVRVSSLLKKLYGSKREQGKQKPSLELKLLLKMLTGLSCPTKLWNRQSAAKMKRFRTDNSRVSVCDMIASYRSNIGGENLKKHTV